SAEILFGASRRLSQAAHAQGAMHLDKTKVYLRTPEARKAALWATKPEFITSLLTQHLPWQIYEFAVLTLARNNSELPPLERETLERFFAAPSAVLGRIAKMRTLKLYREGAPLSPRLAAGLFFTSSPPEQKSLLAKNLTGSPSMLQKAAKLLGAGQNAEKDQGAAAWKDDFADALFEYALAAFQDGKPSRRGVAALELLSREFGTRIAEKNLLPLAAALFKMNSRSLESLVYTSATKQMLAVSDMTERFKLVRKWLETVATPAQATEFQAVLHAAVKENKFWSAAPIYPFIEHPSAFVADFGWLLAEKNLSSNWQLSSIWSRIGHKFFGNVKRDVQLQNFLLSERAMKLFAAFFKKDQYTLLNDYSTPPAFRMFMLQHAPSPLRGALISGVESAFKQRPLQTLWTVANLPAALRDTAWENSRKSFTSVFNSLYDLHEVFNLETDNEKIVETEPFVWMWARFFDLMSMTAFDKTLATDLLGFSYHHSATDPDYDQAKRRILAWVETEAAPQQRSAFVAALGDLLPHYEAAQIARVPKRLFQEAMATLSLENITALIAATDDATWQELKSSIRVRLQSFGTDSAFWKTVLERIVASEPDSMLGVRLLEDGDFLNLFIAQKNPDILQIEHPVFEAVLAQWVKANESLFEKNSSILFALCVHKLPALRAIGLQKASQGMDAGFALRLMESGLPPVMESAKAFIKSLEPASAQMFETVLALCDSPKKPVRYFGLELLDAHKEIFTSGDAKMLELLSEHADAGVHAAVTAALLEQGATGEYVLRFDKEILRMKNRSRKAKENVKVRLDKSLALSAETLLEVARSNSKQDAEWAIVQLTKLALSGREISGFELK
ncbi:MAG: hypothetical protein IAF08_10325, partial [Rhizobacter sp.]|nr:hypothetical protein [Chlorobiales bacterium]